MAPAKTKTKHATLKIRKGDIVEVLTGKDVGRRGKVLEVHPERAPADRREHQHRQAPHQAAARQGLARRRRCTPGGVIEKEAAMRVDNVALVCPRCNHATRVGYRIADNGDEAAPLPPQRAAARTSESDRIAMAETTITPPRLRGRYENECAPCSRSASSTARRCRCPRLQQDHAQHGRRRREDELEGARRGRRAARDHRGPAPADHQGQEVDRRLQAARGHAHRLQGDAARRAHVGVPRPPDGRRPAAHPRLPRARSRPRSTAAATTRWACASRSSFPRSTTTGSIPCAGST